MVSKLLGSTAVIGVVMAVLLVFTFFIYGFTNDYVLYEMHEQTENLYNQNVIGNTTFTDASATLNTFRDFDFLFDWWILGIYIVFLVTTTVLAYEQREENHFGFLTLLFFGTMVLLFVLSLMNTLSTWWIEDILYNLMPNIEGSLPMFEYISDNIGMFTLFHALLLLFVNRMFFNFEQQVRKKGFGVSGDDEIT